MLRQLRAVNTVESKVESAAARTGGLAGPWACRAIGTASGSAMASMSRGARRQGFTEGTAATGDGQRTIGTGS